MSESENIDLIRRFCAAWATPDIAKLLAFFTDDAVYHNMPVQPVQGKDAIKGIIEQFMAPFERGDWEIRHIAAAGDVVLTERVDRFVGADKTVELPVMGVFEIRDGKIRGMLRDVTYQAITTDFWNACDGVCDERFFEPFGILNCGKGDPVQTARMTHGSAPARFKDIRVPAWRA